MGSRTARIAAALLFIACSAPPPQPAATPSQEPIIRIEAPVTARAPRVWAEVDRDVIVTGRVPIIFLNREGTRLGGRRMVRPRRVLGPDGQPVPPACDDANTSVGRWAAANVDLRCVPMRQPGRYVVEIDLAAEGWGTEVLEVPVRVLSSPPEPRPAPDGWVAVPLCSETPKVDCKDSRSYVPTLHDDHLTIEPYERSTSSLPQAVRARLGLAGPASGDCNCSAVAFDGGWMLGSDHGEFGGGLGWLPSTGGAPIKLALSTPTDDPAPQNVRRIERVGDTCMCCRVCRTWA